MLHHYPYACPKCGRVSIYMIDDDDNDVPECVPCGKVPLRRSRHAKLYDALNDVAQELDKLIRHEALRAATDPWTTPTE